MIGLNSLGGAHSDVLSAEPDNIDSKRALVEEIKRRGRVTVGTKNYLDAEALYGKGIDVLSSILSDNKDNDQWKQEVAVFYSNRSLVRMQLGKVMEALEDGDAAVEYDPTYVKAHWRRGQAFTACGRPAEALISFEQALALEPENKALKKEVEAAKERKAQEKRIMETMTTSGAGSNASNDDFVMRDAVNPKSFPTKKKVVSAANEISSSDSFKVEERTDESFFTKSDHIRGYKIRSDGKKTSYFDREISEEEKRLIGDIAPKKIDPKASNGSENDSVPNILPAVEGASAWNKAG